MELLKISTASNGAVLRQAGCNSADSLVEIWKCIARMNISEPPPERKAAGALGASGRQRGGKSREMRTLSLTFKEF
jgi:hypothetical protein